MKRNNTITLMLFAFLASTVLWGCQEDTDLGAFTPTDPKLELLKDMIQAEKLENTYEAGFQSNLPWRVKSDVTWITINDATIRGMETDKLVKFSVGKNPTTEERTGHLIIWITKDYQKEIAIVQEPGDPAPIIKTHVYVKANGTGDGTSWADATTLSDAFSKELEAGDFIHIAAGTYKPTLTVTGGSASGTDDKTFEVKQNINIIGGYPANASEGAVSNPSANITTLDGDKTALHVLTITAPVADDQKVSIQGITIKNGNAAGTGTLTINGSGYAKDHGSGLIVAKSVVEMDNCIVTDNSARSGGAVHTLEGATLSMNNCVVKNNTNTAGNGGAITCYTRSVLYMNQSVVSANGAGSFAGGLYGYGASFYVYNTTFEGNGAGGVGSTVASKHYGGVYLREGTGRLVNCTIHGNTSSANGSGIGVYGTAAVPGVLDVISCTITGNKAISATGKGAGIFVNANATNSVVNLYNTILSGNTAGATGTEGVSDIDGAAGYAYGKKYTVVSAQVFDTNGNVVAGASFDYASMLGALADNGGDTKTCLLLGATNPAKSNGMSVSDLTSLGGGYSPAVPTSVVTADQLGESRNGKPYIGACVK